MFRCKEKFLFFLPHKTLINCWNFNYFGKKTQHDTHLMNFLERGCCIKSGFWCKFQRPLYVSLKHAEVFLCYKLFLWHSLIPGSSVEKLQWHFHFHNFSPSQFFLLSFSPHKICVYSFEHKLNWNVGIISEVAVKSRKMLLKKQSSKSS